MDYKERIHELEIPTLTNAGVFYDFGSGVNYINDPDTNPGVAGSSPSDANGVWQNTNSKIKRTNRPSRC